MSISITFQQKELACPERKLLSVAKGEAKQERLG